MAEETRSGNEAISYLVGVHRALDIYIGKNTTGRKQLLASAPDADKGVYDSMGLSGNGGNDEPIRTVICLLEIALEKAGVVIGPRTYSIGKEPVEEKR